MTQFELQIETLEPESILYHIAEALEEVDIFNIGVTSAIVEPLIG